MPSTFGLCIVGDPDAFWWSGIRVFHLIDNEGNDYIKAEVQDKPDYLVKGVRVRA